MGGWWGRLLKRLGRRPPALARLHVLLYTRRGCRLCEEAWECLDRRRQRFGFRLEAIDVDGDPALMERYGLTVPVVTVNGKERFRGGVSPALLERLLRAESRNA
jgi:glutaredoxin